MTRAVCASKRVALQIQTNLRSTTDRNIRCHATVVRDGKYVVQFFGLHAACIYLWTHSDSAHRCAADCTRATRLPLGPAHAARVSGRLHPPIGAAARLLAGSGHPARRPWRRLQVRPRLASPPARPPAGGQLAAGVPHPPPRAERSPEGGRRSRQCSHRQRLCGRALLPPPRPRSSACPAAAHGRPCPAAARPAGKTPSTRVCAWPCPFSAADRLTVGASLLCHIQPPTSSSPPPRPRRPDFAQPPPVSTIVTGVLGLCRQRRWGEWVRPCPPCRSLAAASSDFFFVGDLPALLPPAAHLPPPPVPQRHRCSHGQTPLCAVVCRDATAGAAPPAGGGGH